MMRRRTISPAAISAGPRTSESQPTKGTTKIRRYAVGPTSVAVHGSTTRFASPLVVIWPRRGSRSDEAPACSDRAGRTRSITKVKVVTGTGAVIARSPGDMTGCIEPDRTVWARRSPSLKRFPPRTRTQRPRRTRHPGVGDWPSEPPTAAPSGRWRMWTRRRCRHIGLRRRRDHPRKDPPPLAEPAAALAPGPPWVRGERSQEVPARRGPHGPEGARFPPKIGCGNPQRSDVIERQSP